MMKKLLTKVGAGMATGGLILATLAPAAAFADNHQVTISGNGLSQNIVVITNVNTHIVTKTNVATITNTVVTSQNTGTNLSLLGGGNIVSGSNSSIVSINNSINQN